MRGEDGIRRRARTLRRFVRVRLLFVLIALLLLPAFALPFAERLRSEWARYWEPKADAPLEIEVLEDIEIPLDLDEVNAMIATSWNCDGCSVVIAPPTGFGDAFPVIGLTFLDGADGVLSEEELRELRNRQLALEVADIRTNCPFLEADEEASNVALQTER